MNRVHTLGDTNFLFVCMILMVMISFSSNYFQDLVDFVKHYQGKHYKGFLIPGHSVVKIDLKRVRYFKIYSSNDNYKSIV